MKQRATSSATPTPSTAAASRSSSSCREWTSRAIRETRRSRSSASSSSAAERIRTSASPVSDASDCISVSSLSAKCRGSRTAAKRRRSRRPEQSPARTRSSRFARARSACDRRVGTTRRRRPRRRQRPASRRRRPTPRRRDRSPPRATPRRRSALARRYDPGASAALLDQERDDEIELEQLCSSSSESCATAPSSQPRPVRARGAHALRAPRPVGRFGARPASGRAPSRARSLRFATKTTTGTAASRIAASRGPDAAGERLAGDSTPRR